MRKRHPWYRIQNAAKADEATIYIYDMIDPFWGVAAGEFVREVAAIKASIIHVRINSPGGDVFDSLAIYNALKRHPSEVVTHVDGLAASSASIVALAGDRVLMGAGAFLMIHNAWGFAVGDAAEMRAMADTLEKVNGSLVGIYATRTGMDAPAIQALLDAETWLTAEDAVAQGFADGTEEATKASASFDLSRFRNVPRPLQGAAPEEAPKKIETVRDLEAFLRDEGGLSHAAAKAVAAAGWKGTTPEPRDEDGAGQAIQAMMAQLAHTQLAAALTH